MNSSIIKKLWIAPSRLVRTNFLWNWSSAFKGNWITFADMRAYQWWDPWKSIDWITTAKKNELYIKEYEEERQLRIMCAVDIGASMSFTTCWVSKLNKAREVVTLFSYAARCLWDKLWWFTFDDSVTNWTKPQWSIRTALRFDESIRLSALNLEKKSTWSNINKLISSCIHNNLSHSLLVIFCDDFIDESHVMLRGIAKRNEVVFIHLFDQFEIWLQWSIKQWYLWMKHGAYFSNTPSQQKRYQEKFEEKRAKTQELITKWWWSYCRLLTQDDTLLVLMKFFMKRKRISR